MNGLADEGRQSDIVPARFVVVGILTALAGLVLIGSAFAVFSRSEGVGTAEALSRLHEAGCDVRTVPATSAGHFDRLDVDVDYNSDPASNGSHYWSPALWGLHREPVDQRQLVHNLEHGGIAIQYGRQVSERSKTRLRQFYFEDRNAMVLAPRTELGRRVALTAWVMDPERPAPKGRFGAGYVALCPDFDDAAFSGFRSAFRYRGPESRRFPKFLLEPGL